MLNSLRWKLSFLYLIAAIGLVSLMGVGTYILINRYFQQTTDLALQYKMAIEFRILRLTLPDELVQAETTWAQNNTRVTIDNVPGIDGTHQTESEEAEHSEEKEHEKESEAEEYYENERDYDDNLAAIFVVSLDDDGEPILIPNSISPPVINNPEIISSALTNGWDLRTVEVPEKGRVRLLTYRTDTGVPAILQTGRLLANQDRALNQYLIFMAILGGSAIFLLVFISWWLAGRSLGPAQQAWDQQQTFVSNASHELRSPLTLIRATADYGLRSQPPEENAKVLTDILNECDYMDHLVDDLLLLSRLDAHRLRMELEAIEIAELLSETIRQIKKLDKTGDISIELKSANGVILADRIRLRQILFILLDNAIRFTPQGGSIQLSAQQIDKSVHIDVTDTGKGIDLKHLPHLYDRFYQVSTPENDLSRSNGLGLSIAKKLIEAQNGSIHIDSVSGKGTKVRLTFPIAEKKKSRYKSKNNTPPGTDISSP